MRKTKATSSRFRTSTKKLKSNNSGIKCYAKTSMSVFVKRKEVVPCFRYKDGSAFDDEHYVTTLVLSDGTEITSYSKFIFYNVIENQNFEIPVSFITLPSGKHLIYA